MKSEEEAFFRYPSSFIDSRMIGMKSEEEEAIHWCGGHILRGGGPFVRGRKRRKEKNEYKWK